MKHESIQELFDQAAARFSHLPAIERGAFSLSYGELADRSNRLANYLLASGLTAGTTVAILSEDVVDIVTAIIASLKARCVFVPLDPALPEKRLESLVAEVKPPLFISEPRFIDRIGALTSARVVCLTGAEFEEFSDNSNPRLATGPDDMCHIYFTSDSTGRPKGITGRLKGIAHFINWETHALHLAAGTRVSQLNNPTFDAFLRDIFVPLSIGGTICVPPARELDTTALIQWLDRQHINVIHTVPSQFRAIINAGIEPRLFEALQYVLLSGEPLLPADVRKWMSVFGKRVQLINLYGPTETTMTKFFYFVKPSDQNRAFIPVGQPMPGARALLLDERGRLCPPGAVGEIYIRTPYRSLGYWNQPQETREAFIHNPFSDDPHDIIYKTGDLGRVLEDGVFQILGRRDRQASHAMEREYVAPRNGLEQELVEIWREVLGVEQIGVDDNFFEMGGHSVIATRAVSRVHKQLNVRVELREFFAHPTIAELAQLITELKPAEYVEIAPAPSRALYEVSNAQRRLWVLHQLENEFTAYNICGAYILEGTLNLVAFNRAFATLVARNESLRTTFVQVDGEPMQRIHSAEEFSFAVEHTDLRNHADRMTTARKIANRDAVTVFDLSRGPLLKANLLRLEDSQYLFVLTMHHIISDGWSMAVLVDQVLNCYKAFSSGAEDPLPPLRIQYKDYAVWQREQLTGAQLEAHQSYWWKQFSGEVPVLALPNDFPRPPVKTYHGDRVTGVLDHDATQTAFKLGQQQGASLFMVLLAAVNALLYRYTMQQDIVIGSPLAGRDHHELEEQIGYYINTLALRTRPSGDDSFGVLLEKVKTTTLEAYGHQIYPFDRLVDELHLRRDTSRLPLFDVLIEVQNTDLSGRQIPVIEGLTVRNFELDNPISKFDLNFRFWEAQDELHAQIEYNTDLFKRTTIERMLGHLQRLFRSAMAHPEQHIGKLPMLTEAEQQQLINWNDSKVKLPEVARSVAQIIEDIAAATPERTAVVFRDQTVSYGELNDEANRLAHFLNSQVSLAPDQRVALLMERSDLMVACILAVWKLGAAYVPVDINYPADRIRTLITDAEARLILTDSAAAAAGLPAETTGLIRLDQHATEIAAQPAANLALPFAPESLAYVIYTSGSTGKPKGVMIEHIGMLNHLFAKIAEFEL
ncbi:MAG TPA: amino acid adenylation domain-containing protein, partial [Pyrinomonadaceae bacterium]|nr:amino acid adenylation domain-containing protein [Pyrinomonadaceae bacterium]